MLFPPIKDGAISCMYMPPWEYTISVIALTGKRLSIAWCKNIKGVAMALELLIWKHSIRPLNYCSLQLKLILSIVLFYILWYYIFSISDHFWANTPLENCYIFPYEFSGECVFSQMLTKFSSVVGQHWPIL